MKRRPFTLIVDGLEVSALDLADRGLAYGDGLFETIRVWRGEAVLWREHLARLRRGARRLGITADWAQLAKLSLARASVIDDGVLKLILTRGAGGRGYAPPEVASSALIIGAFPVPPKAPPGGLSLRWCRARLARQPLLAGIKHLNRLEQVLARAEWRDQRIQEGLICDTEGRVICATSANLFVLQGGRWLTPSLADCGIAGTLRGWLLRRVKQAAEAELSPASVEQADAVFLCNSLRGILPVRRLGRRQYAPHPALASLQVQLARTFPVFA
jgi:4-amino-4-deoxychorismate lyase